MKQVAYQKIIDKHQIKPNYLKNTLSAFFFGGVLSLIGQSLSWFYENRLGLERSHASSYMVITLIFASCLLTGLGVYDKFGQYAKSGSLIPITGFANSLTSAALEGKSEGIILGIAGNLFKLSGLVLSVAVVAGFVFGLLRYFLVHLGIAPALDHTTVMLLEAILCA